MPERRVDRFSRGRWHPAPTGPESGEVAGCESVEGSGGALKGEWGSFNLGNIKTDVRFPSMDYSWPSKLHPTPTSCAWTSLSAS